MKIEVHHDDKINDLDLAVHLAHPTFIVLVTESVTTGKFFHGVVLSEPNGNGIGATLTCLLKDKFVKFSGKLILEN